MTLQQKYAAALIAMGFAEMDSGSRKYRLFTKSTSSVAYVWLGRSGSARFAYVRRMDASVPFTAKSKAILIAKGEEALASRWRGA
jgi:hypothetical protein